MSSGGTNIVEWRIDGAELTELLFQDPATGLLIVDREGWVERANDTVARMTALPLDQIEGWPAFMLSSASDRADVKARLASAATAIDEDGSDLYLRGTGLRVAVETRVRPTSGGYLLRLRERSPERPRGVECPADSPRAGAGLAHDLNNVLGVLLTGVETLRDDPACRDSPRCLEVLSGLRGGVLRGRELVSRLNPRGPVSPIPLTDLAADATIADLAGMLGSLFPAAIRIRLDLKAGDERVRADPTRFDQMLLNLAVNARDAMPDGGALTIRSRRVSLAHGQFGVLGEVPAGDYLALDVEDSGVGMASDMLPRVFTAFFTTRHEQGGTGLGLATVREIVAEFGGFIDVRSELGRGTCMRVYLPLIGRERGGPKIAPAHIAATPSEPAVGRGTVLLVEDEPSLRKLTEAALRRGGWRVLSAEDAATALASVAASTGAGRPSVVVTDIALPDMNGWALAHAVRARLAAPELPVVLTSGASTRSLAVEMARLGMAAVFLAKPYSLVELEAALARFAHGPGPIHTSSLSVNSPLDEHMTNEPSRNGLRSIARGDLDMTDSVGGA